MFSELSTMDRMKTRRPDLYNSPEWHCILCNEEEDFTHLWSCKERRTTINTLVQDTITDLVNMCSTSLTELKKPTNIIRKSDISSLTCWSFNSSDFTLSDLIKGYIPLSLSLILNTWGLKAGTANNIIVKTISALQGKLKNIWTQRCELVVEKERLRGISRGMKRKKTGGRVRINTDNLVFPVINYDNGNNNINNNHREIDNSWRVWLKLGLLFGNSWQDF
jgi:hypothetical protein